ncbi:MAG TPA: response regulator [Tahibacter sp.]|uniref:response regulator n=1 Tax=Tahibacter sp. TaxID=2056211 RepID=UPI002C4A09BB|nr:response regulator [Tahibacter sp.]HSX59941.1 response regulator [Tahibacter sp.]
MELLIADDNALSLRFLADAAALLGHRCETAEDGEAALALARRRRYDLLLLDVHMPHLDGPAALACLRADATAASQRSPALATTADADPAVARELHTLGFAGVLHKPVDLDGLRAALQLGNGGHTGVAEAAPSYAEAPLLDDAAACRSLGSQETVIALRGLFAQELDALPGELDALLAKKDGVGLRERLHRLCASAGFCGAPRLEQTCRRLRTRVLADVTFTAEDLTQLHDVAAATRRALDGV